MLSPADGVFVFDLAVPTDSNGLEATVGMLSNPEALLRWRELLRDCIVEHQERANILRECHATEAWVDVEAIANPMWLWLWHDFGHHTQVGC